MRTSGSRSGACSTSAASRRWCSRPDSRPSPAGLPLSLQIAAKPFAEETIYAAAAAFERATSWHLKRPLRLVHDASRLPLVALAVTSCHAGPTRCWNCCPARSSVRRAARIAQFDDVRAGTLPDGGRTVKAIADAAPGGAFDPRQLERPPTALAIAPHGTSCAIATTASTGTSRACSSRPTSPIPACRRSRSSTAARRTGTSSSSIR